MIFSDRVIKMIHPKEFDRLFWKEVPNHKTHEKAFEKLNEEYRKATGQPRYSNYNSYRNARDNRIQMSKRKGA